VEDSAATAALVGVVLALVELVKKLTGKVNGGQNGNRHVDYRLEAMSDQIDELKEAVLGLKTSFYEFREEVRIRLVKLGDDE
jgi:hypothetical protein